MYHTKVTHDKDHFLNCLYYNGRVHTLVSITDDDDVHTMMKIGWQNTNAILLDVSSRRMDEPQQRHKVRHQIEGRAENNNQASRSKTIQPHITRNTTSVVNPHGTSWR